MAISDGASNGAQSPGMLGELAPHFPAGVAVLDDEARVVSVDHQFRWRALGLSDGLECGEALLPRLELAIAQGAAHLAPVLQGLLAVSAGRVGFFEHAWLVSNDPEARQERIRLFRCDVRGRPFVAMIQDIAWSALAAVRSMLRAVSVKALLHPAVRWMVVLDADDRMVGLGGTDMPEFEGQPFERLVRAEYREALRAAFARARGGDEVVYQRIRMQDLPELENRTWEIRVRCVELGQGRPGLLLALVDASACSVPLPSRQFRARDSGLSCTDGMSQAA